MLSSLIGTASIATALCCASAATAADAPTDPDPSRPTTEAANAWSPSLAPLLGISVPLTGSSLGFRVGVKADIADLSSQTPGLHLVIPVAFTFERSITGGEVSAGFEYGRFVSGALAWFADLTLGYRHDHQVVSTRFVGYTIQAGNFFVARMEGGVTYRFSGSILGFFEPINFGVYRGTGTALDWAPQLGLEFRI